MMNLAICSLASGSSGNCYLVCSPSTALLVDAGISAKQIEQRLASVGVAAEKLQAVLITHEHQDHVKGLPVLLKKYGFKTYASGGTASHVDRVDAGCFEVFSAGSSFRVGDIDVDSFAVSHDAAQPVGFRFRSGGRQICLATDTGILTDEILCGMKGSDILVLEANHDENILRIGRYPWFLKQRILSETGHLSNDSAAEGLAKLLQGCGGPEKKTVLLAHLSRENNFPELAKTTVINVLAQCGIETGKDLRIETLPGTEISPLYTV